MNCELFPSGIQTERSDIRAHVSVKCREIYVYETVSALSVLNEGEYRTAEASQPGVGGMVTGKGKLTPWRDIPGIRRLKFYSWERWGEFDKVADSTTGKGNLAVECVIELIRIGRFPFWVKNAREEKRESIQIKGTDILLFVNKRIQVKCDWICGDVERGGSGNLFLQLAESNPLKKY